MTTPMKYINMWLLTGILMICSMVIIGGITRLTESGLSIVEWKPVTGAIPPLNEKDWNQEFEKYKQFPEYKKLNYGISLQQFKQIFIWEYLHRLLGRLIGIIFIVPFAIFYFKGWITKKLMGPLMFIFLLGALQGFMGWYMVKSGLDKIPHVSHFRLAMHQGLAFLLVSLLYWLMLKIRFPKKKDTRPSAMLNVTLFLLVLLIVQITLGAFVAGLNAGFSYNNFPWMGETFFPSAQHINAESFLYNGVVLQFIHRWFGFIVGLGVVLLVFMARDKRDLYRPAKMLLALIIFQIALGIVTLMMSVPIVLGVVHQFTAILIVLLLIRILHKQVYEYPKSEDQDFNKSISQGQ